MRWIKIGTSNLKEERIDLSLSGIEVEWQSPESTQYAFGGKLKEEKFRLLRSLEGHKCYFRTQGYDYGPRCAVVQVHNDSTPDSRVTMKKYTCTVAYSPPEKSSSPA